DPTPAHRVSGQPAGGSFAQSSATRAAGAPPPRNRLRPGLRSVGSARTLRLQPARRISMVRTATKRKRLRAPMTVDCPRSRTAASRRACAIRTTSGMAIFVLTGSDPHWYEFLRASLAGRVTPSRGWRLPAQTTQELQIDGGNESDVVLQDRAVVRARLARGH